MLKLKTTVTDNHNNIYNVFMDGTGKMPIIRIRGQVISHNGGSWYLETLLERKSDKLSIDFGQNWYLNGMHAVYNEIETMEKNV